MSAAVALDLTDPQIVRSELLGDVEVQADQLFVFPNGIHGFPDVREFALIPTPRAGVFWLQSTGIPGLSFLLADPFTCFAGPYHVDLTADDLARLGTVNDRHILTLAVVTLPMGSEPATMNLRAPLLLNLDGRRAFQLIRADEGFGIREALSDAVLGGDA